MLFFYYTDWFESEIQIDINIEWQSEVKAFIFCNSFKNVLYIITLYHYYIILQIVSFLWLILGFDISNTLWLNALTYLAWSWFIALPLIDYLVDWLIRFCCCWFWLTQSVIHLKDNVLWMHLNQLCCHLNDRYTHSFDIK